MAIDIAKIRVGDKVYYQTLCSHCGSYWTKKKNEDFLCLNEDMWSTWTCTSLKNWNALVLYKHDEQFWL